MNGWVKIHRSILDWEWWHERNTRDLFFYLLIAANHDDQTWQGKDVPRGSIATSRKKLMEAVDLTEQEVRTALNNLQNSRQITSKTTNKNTIITICNYDKYQMQDEDEQPAEQPTNNQPANQPITSNGEKEKEKEKKNPPITPYKENKNKNKKSEQEEKKKENIIASTIVEAPKKKSSAEEKKIHGELKNIFCEEWKKTHGEEFYWSAAAMTSTIKIADQIKFYMPQEQKNDPEQLKLNFRIFVQKILTSSDNWLRTNATPQIIASKFNEIYTSLKNGNASTNSNRPDGRPSMVERTLSKYAAMYGNGQPDGGVGSQC